MNVNIRHFLKYVLKDIPYETTIFILKHICKIFPIANNKIVFSNFNGKGIGDNPKYILKEIIRQGIVSDLVWLTKDKTDMPKVVRTVSFYSFRTVYEISTAKIIINNVKNGLPYIKRPGQYVIQTWHASLALKLIEAECEEKLSKDYVLKSKVDSKQTDLILTCNEFDRNIIRSAFWYNGEIMLEGLPRNDIFFRNSLDDKKRIRRKIDGLGGNKVVMYAPTFRNDNDMSCYDLDYGMLLETLNQKRSGSWTLLLRMHPNVDVSRLSEIAATNIINVSSYSDPQELVLISDLLITDYSSISIDATLNRTPVLIYASDIEKYKSGRGLRSLYFELPFSFCDTNEKVQTTISEFDVTSYWDKVDVFMHSHVNFVDNGHASETVVQRIKEVIDGSFFTTKP